MRFPDPSDIAEKLADRAEAVCRAYLPNGCKNGNYWMIGDATGVPGRSMYVRLRGPLSGKGAAGKWTDAASGEHGNLLDIIRLSQGLVEFRDVIAEACRFLSLPDPTSGPDKPSVQARRPANGQEVAHRLFTSSRALAGSIGETYLNARGINLQPDFDALRFQPRCFHGSGQDGKPVVWPGLIAAVTDTNLDLRGVSRTYLSRDGSGKAPVDPPRRAKGDILGNGIRFGVVDDILAAGEGIETTLSLRAAMPALPLIAATSSSHLSAMHFPPGLRTLLVIRDNDHAGDMATDALFARGHSAGIEVALIEPQFNDLNLDLTKLGREAFVSRIRDLLPGRLVERFIRL